MAALLFVYGTLKDGFPNHALNQGRRIPGDYRTKKAFPLYVVRLPNEVRAPWLVDLPGEGHQVVGQVFQVEPSALQAMDAFEEVGRSTGYVRVEIELVPVSVGGTELSAFSYLKPEDQLSMCLATEGPFSEYTHELAVGYQFTAV
jgi:gamma-glutamylaminecyclotransferase